MSRCIAVVKWFDNDRGFGFLSDSEGRDVFVHHSSLMMDGYRYLVEGQEVEYTQVTTGKGFAAAEVEPVDLPIALIAFPADPMIAAKVLREKFSDDDLDVLMDALEVSVSS